jgi:hypothetical protein
MEVEDEGHKFSPIKEEVKEEEKVSVPQLTFTR